MCSKGWGYRCARAHSTKCTCKCGGICHGKAVGASKLEIDQMRQADTLPLGVHNMEYVQPQLHYPVSEPVHA